MEEYDDRRILEFPYVQEDEEDMAVRALEDASDHDSQFRTDFELMASHAAGKPMILPKQSRLSVPVDEIQKLEVQREGD